MTQSDTDRFNRYQFCSGGSFSSYPNLTTSIASFWQAWHSKVVMPSPMTAVHRSTIITMAAERRIPAVYPYRYFVVDGGLLAYGVDIRGQFRQAAFYINRILQGTKPSDLPVQQPSKFELVINLKTAKALGLNLKPALLTQADEVIE
jgi:putative ABC transport system substrate-binding protein